MLAIEIATIFYFALIFIYEWEDGNFGMSTLALVVGTWFGVLLHPDGAGQITVAGLELLCARLNFKTVNIEGTA